MMSGIANRLVYITDSISLAELIEVKRLRSPGVNASAPSELMPLYVNVFDPERLVKFLEFSEAIFALRTFKAAAYISSLLGRVVMPVQDPPRLIELADKTQTIYVIYVHLEGPQPKLYIVEV